MVAFWALQLLISGQLVSGDDAISSYPAFLHKLRALHHAPILPLEADPEMNPEIDPDMTNGKQLGPSNN